MGDEQVPELVILGGVERSGAGVERRRDAVDDRRRAAQLVRGERDEVALQLPEPLELLLLERPLEREGDERGAGRQDVEPFGRRSPLARRRQEADDPGRGDERQHELAVRDGRLARVERLAEERPVVERADDADAGEQQHVLLLGEVAVRVDAIESERLGDARAHPPDQRLHVACAGGGRAHEIRQRSQFTGHRHGAVVTTDPDS